MFTFQKQSYLLPRALHIARTPYIRLAFLPLGFGGREEPQLVTKEERLEGEWSD